MDWPDVQATSSSVAQAPRGRYVCGRTVTSFAVIPCLDGLEPGLRRLDRPRWAIS